MVLEHLHLTLGESFIVKNIILTFLALIYSEVSLQVHLLAKTNRRVRVGCEQTSPT